MDRLLFYVIALSPAAVAVGAGLLWFLFVRPRHRGLEMRHVIRETLSERDFITTTELYDLMEARGTRVSMTAAFSELNGLCEDGLLDYRYRSASNTVGRGGIREYFRSEGRPYF